MTQGKKTPIDIKAAIIAKRINTNAQGSVIADEVGIPERTVQHILNTEFAEVCGESEKVAELIDRNDNLQSAADTLIAELIASKDDSVTVAQLTTLRESTFKQNQLLKGKNTENNKVTIEWSI